MLFLGDRMEKLKTVSTSCTLWLGRYTLFKFTFCSSMLVNIMNVGACLMHVFTAPQTQECKSALEGSSELCLSLESSGLCCLFI